MINIGEVIETNEMVEKDIGCLETSFAKSMSGTQTEKRKTF